MASDQHTDHVSSGQFDDAEGKKSGQLYTPLSIVKILVDILAPTPEGRVYDGACGSDGMFVKEQMQRATDLDNSIKSNLSKIGYGS